MNAAREYRSASKPARSSAPGRSEGFRLDIEGMRGLAMVAVLASHADIPHMIGGYIGVDMFFVISGFLITGLLLVELERTGGISLAQFYARRAKRILPLAITVLGTVVVLSALLFSPVRADVVSRDVMAAGAYVVNWRFAAQSIDYFATGNADSPVQHYWSLSVEEQFYLVWPALLLALTWWSRRKGRNGRVALWVGLGAVACASMAYAIHIAHASPNSAYFATPGRTWELALGGLLALVLSGRRLGPRAAWAAAWAGLAAIVASSFLFVPETPFPALPALVPTLGTAALIAAGTAHAAPGPIRALKLRPIRFVGRISYAWYLWHWPVLVFAAAAFGPLSMPQKVVVTLLSVVPTVLTHRWIEEPLRRSKLHLRMPRTALAAGPACAGVAVALGVALTMLLPSVPTLAAGDAPGAEALHKKRTVQRSANSIRPAPRKANDDRSQGHEDGCFLDAKTTRSPHCVYGRRGAGKTLVLFGDSHAMQWFAALRRIADTRGWRFVALGKSGCPPAAMTVYNGLMRRTYRECDVWRERALRRIERVQGPALVVTSERSRYTLANRRHATRSQLVRAYSRTLRRLTRSGARVAVIRDTPQPPQDIPTCVADAMDHLRRCAFSRRRALDRPSVDRGAVKHARGVKLINATSRFCFSKLCPAVIGNVLVYRHTGHLTGTYSRTMARWLGRRLPHPR
ncbi:MAG TPA: acyltransferase family protein [Solirubrobacter sp.]|nr:acyltransferase family protein [Solirubrobacter sp.]